MSDFADECIQLNRAVIELLCESRETPDYVDMLIGEAIKKDNPKAAVANLIHQRLNAYAGVFGVIASRLSHAVEANEAIGQYEADEANAQLAVAKARIADLERQLMPKRPVHKLTDPGIRKMVFDLTDGRCAYCDREVVDGAGEVPHAMCIEHVVPQALGGPDHFTNYVPSCRPCNVSKRNRHVIYLVRKMLGKDPTLLRPVNDTSADVPERYGDEAAS